MNPLTQAARLKIKGDTFYLPIPNEGVYFRNNVGSFRMEGDMMDRWIEKLFPMFNGENTLGQLTDGLSAPYRDRVYEIAEVLFRNGFARDTSQDRQHQLPDGMLHRYGSQIAFLDSFGHSGAYRFQCYREASVLAAGSGPFLLSLVSSLIESGLPKFSVYLTDSAATNRNRLDELVRHAKKTDAEVEVRELTLSGSGETAWRELIRPFQSIMYASHNGSIEEIRMLQAACREEKKTFFPAMLLQQAGMAGPIVHPESDVCLESAWRRLHRSEVQKDPELHKFSPTAGAMLANVLVFEHFKSVTRAVESELRNALYLLNLETLEGSWHKVLPHPLAGGSAAIKAEWTQDLDSRLEDTSAGGGSNALFISFNQLTSKQTGIFHSWEEGDLRQLPLSQCLVQAVDPLAEGPAELLPEIVCSGFTHEEARREAGIAGLEAYVSRLAEAHLDHFAGIGVGGTVAEAAARGIQACLAEKLVVKHAAETPAVTPVQLSAVEDDRCRFYLQALTIMRGMPAIGFGEEVAGFPVVWVGTGDRWYGSTGLNMTLAFRKSLQAALLSVQNPSGCRAAQTLEASSVLKDHGSYNGVVVPSCEGVVQPAVLKDALHVLRRNGHHLLLADMAAEPFLKEIPGAVLGVVLREGEPC